jgi:hypothetical protein
MFFIILILSILAFFKTLGYAIYEYTHCKNKLATICIVILAVISLVAPCLVTDI